MFPSGPWDETQWHSSSSYSPGPNPDGLVSGDGTALPDTPETESGKGRGPENRSPALAAGVSQSQAIFVAQRMASTGRASGGMLAASSAIAFVTLNPHSSSQLWYVDIFCGPP